MKHRQDETELFKKEKKFICIMTLFLYLAIVYKSTIFNRAPSISAKYQLIPLWSYYNMIFNGDSSLGIQIVMNMLMFVPIGFLLTDININKKYKTLRVVFYATFFSVLIELGQYFFHTGLCELDDIFDNSIGALFGYFIYKIYQKYNYIFMKNKKLQYIRSLIICAGIIIGGLFAYQIYEKNNQDDSFAEYMFCLEQVNIDSVTSLEGYCFVVDPNTNGFNYELYLKSVDTGELIELELKSEKVRTDVAKYFGYENNYYNSGYVVEVKDNFDKTTSYELMIKWNAIPMKSTGYFVRGEIISHVCLDSFIQPQVNNTELEPVVRNGVLLAYNPDYLSYVYQYDNKIYWLIDKECELLNNQLKIPYLIWTTQQKMLPKEMLKIGATRDSRGRSFVDDEITKEIKCGRYRVSVKDIPHEYPITCIKTGFYISEKWIWSSFCRLIIDL